MITKVVYPDEHDITDEQPRIGVFICHCGRNIASVVDVEKVVAAVAQEPNVVLSHSYVIHLFRYQSGEYP